MKNALVVGGSGLLGHHAVAELVASGYHVTSVSLPPFAGAAPTSTGTCPELVLADVNEMTDGELANLFTGQHAVVWAAGADERVVPEAPAAHYYYEVNVRPVQRAARVARKVGVSRFVLLGSHAAEFAELWPDLRYRTRNGYPRTLLVQEEVATLEGEGSMDVMTLRLPYVFGTMPGRTPMWQSTVDRVAIAPEKVVVPAGATSSVTVAQVGQAVVGAIEHGEHGARYPINGHDLTYVELNRIVCEVIGRNPDDVVAVPLADRLPAMERHDTATTAMGKEHGIHLADTARFQDRHACSDPARTQPVLGYQDDDVPAAIRATIAVCLADMALRDG